MKKKGIGLLFAAIGCLMLYKFIIADFDRTPATIYFNGEIITMEDDRPTAEAMLVENGKIQLIGSNDEVLAQKTNTTLLYDLNGGSVMPGFVDGHTHVALSSFLAGMIDLSGFRHDSAEQVWSYLQEEITKTDQDWVLCKGLDMVLVEDLEPPSLSFLDSLSPEKPLVILSQSLHSYWLNSAALDRVGIDKSTPNPSSSSYYERDSQGNLTGLIVEQKAFKPVIDKLKEEVLSSKVLSRATRDVLRSYARNGNTTVVSTGISINDAKPLRLYEHLAEENPSFLNQLLAKIGLLPHRSPYPRHFIFVRQDRDFLLYDWSRREDDFFNILGVKLWGDGSPYIGSMFLEDPYLVSDLDQDVLHIPEGSRGSELLNAIELSEHIEKYHEEGWQVAIHTQGDAAINNALQAFEMVNKSQSIQTARHRLEHCLLLPNTSLNQMIEMGITPSYHINHLYYYGEALKNHIIGEARAENMLPVGVSQKSGMTYSLHADQPMFESKPFRLIQTAVERKTKEGDTIGFHNRISVYEGLKAMTINAAWQIKMETQIGSLKKGKYADFVILDKNPLTTSTDNLDKIAVKETFINGNRVE